MLQKTVARKIFNIIVLLIVAWTALQSAYHPAYQLLDEHKQTQVSAQRCHSEKSSTAKTSQICQQSGENFFAIPLDYLISLKLLSGKIAFIHILALLAMSPIYLIYKPPKNC